MPMQGGEGRGGGGGESCFVLLFGPQGGGEDTGAVARSAGNVLDVVSDARFEIVKHTILWKIFPYAFVS